MYVSSEIYMKGKTFLSTYEALQLMLSFGGFILTLIGIVIAIVNLGKKNNRKL